MADIFFFLNQFERKDFVSLCFSQGFRLIPDIHYEDNSYYLIKTLKEYDDYMEDCVGFFLTHDNYKIYPLEMDYFKKGKKRIYYIMQHYGGPSILFHSPIFAEREHHKIGPGSLSMYSFYYHYDEKFIPNTSLKSFYNLLTSYIRKNSKKIKIGKRIYWIGKNSIEEVKKGNLSFVEMDDFDWNSVVN